MAEELHMLQVKSDGQLTLSAEARKELGMHEGDTYFAVVVERGILLMKEDPKSANRYEHARKVMADAGITADQLVKEADRSREERFAQRYPDLCDDPDAIR
jgi:bifunctional DNA-binding transcriptional regulator/antitoxin component of YhaV-PrlF toxin-antitoxin module